ncbi:CinA family protein [Mycetocola spongiae]|uniref:CinA family protein n=1 Tax=Mycetocola spongiae TaxID=2859226 RepID=UPI001CF516F4|nr:CinA family protein [Mycetocola spongiae]UCR90003.1 nicotinamide-nucleotide amidohydrolase family protein [Mycetocola spongiae]
MSAAAELLRDLARAGLTVATAESLTGGLLAATLIDVPGASAVVRGGIIAYDTGLKESLLGVEGALLARSGPVHPEVARQMARGVRRACALGVGEPAIGIATTGVAGPDPDPATGQGAGTVYLGISSARGERCVALKLAGDRGRIRADTVAAALAEIASEAAELATFPRS